MGKFTERDLEAAIEEDLVNGGYFKRDASKYDKGLCLDTEILFYFITATQGKEWDEYKKQLGERAEDALCAKIKDAVEKRGTLDLLRKSFTSYGVHFDFAWFKPASTMNETYQKKYQNNMFSVMRQVHYSEHNNKSLDMVLFLNGIPLATLELKDRMTGSGYNVENAKQQYRDDRDPREPLFRYGRCLVHFAADEEEVCMATCLKGAATYFLPFNKGYKGDAGNPPADGFSTEYLWKEVLQRDSFLDLLKHFIQETDVMDDDNKPTGEKELLFPRYHQMDCVRKIIAHAHLHGTGHQYLVQHSAGSGKTNTISWLAHQLSNLHDTKDVNVFDSIIVVTDRRVLDAQLQKTVIAFGQNKGVVAGIEKGSKQLKEELEAGTKIIVTTLQKFPYIEQQIKHLPGKRFAVIIDEAHSSSRGEMVTSLRKVLNLNNRDDEEGDEEERTYEDDIIDQMEARKKQPNASYFAFTATPKPKTLELFGILQDDGSYRPFHVYTMKQAIREQFILDVVPNYITYKTFFKIIKKIAADPDYDRTKASRLLLTYVEMHEQTVGKKTAIIIKHFMENCIHELNGHAKAMLVCASRAQALRYKFAFDAHISENKLPLKTLVAFSGTIRDEETNTEYTEARLNGFPEDQTANMFKLGEYRFLIVANKFQTGFDQKLLYAMYLNKKVQGVNAVQTISRLNRRCEGKKEPVTIDFVNDAETIRKAFQNFYEDVSLEEGSDPDKLYDLKRTLDDFHFYTEADIEEFNKRCFLKNIKQAQREASAFLKPLIHAIQKEKKSDREKFRAVLKSFIRVYAFLAQLVSFSDIALEKLYQFGKILLRKLPYDRQTLPNEVLQQVDLESIRIQDAGKGFEVKSGEGGRFKPGDENPITGGREFIEPLSLIIKNINEKFGGNFSDSAAGILNTVFMGMRKDREMEEEVKNNPKENVWYAFRKKFNDSIRNIIEKDFEFYKQLNNDPKIKEELMMQMFAAVYESFKKAG